ncbi:hypothetical protein DY000_02031915 [Brassica cretica]|uniref:GRF-type domain-containing protein n=1 Tax=Brassica cretica TaxID=69181 RepID=A0ABQ7DFC5_BRACR|nr:hypothetical protein DY000_02031915 [Brassica cretica]
MMSSCCEDSSVNAMGIRGIPEKCDCGRSTAIYTSKSKQNPGRTFFRCPMFQNVNEAVYEEVQDALSKVECFASDLMKIKMEIESFKTAEEELKEDVKKASNELKKLNVIMKIVELPMVMLELVKSELELVKSELVRIQLVTL